MAKPDGSPNGCVAADPSEDVTLGGMDGPILECVNETFGGETGPRVASAGFRVPFGLDPSGALVAPEKAVRSERYVCPACGDRLTYRAGQIVAANFAHRGGTNCTPESALHAAAKLLVAESVRVWLAGSGPRPVVRRACSCDLVKDDPIRDGVAGVTLEHRLRAGERDLVADVALLDAAGGIRLLVEILVHHEVDPDKRKALAAGSIPWIELEAEMVINDAAVWTPRATGNVRAIECRVCKPILEARAATVRRVAKKANLPASPRGYVVTTYPCYRCRVITPLYFWEGMFVYSDPPEPVPASVQMRYSQPPNRRYYANTCGFCEVMIFGEYAAEYLWTAVFTATPVNPALYKFFQEWHDVEPGPLGMTELMRRVGQRHKLELENPADASQKSLATDWTTSYAIVKAEENSMRPAEQAVRATFKGGSRESSRS
jgi:hypothetical protein